MAAVIEARGISVVVDGRALFADLDLVVDAGESVAVVGPSGSGKSSLLAVLAGLSRPAEGEVKLDGTPIDWLTGSARGVALILQGYGLVSLLTASENVFIALRAAGAPIGEARQRASEALRQVGLAAHADQMVETLSGGQQQRTAVARALALRPRVLIADEPTAELDPASRVLVLSRLLDANAAGCALIVATHDAEVASSCARTVELRRSILTDTRRP